MKTRWVVCVLALAMMSPGATTSGERELAGTAEATASGSCAFYRTSFVTAEESGPIPFTTSSSFVVVPDMSISFTIGRFWGPTCVKVDFSGSAAALEGGVLVVRAVLDGTVVGRPGIMTFSSDELMGSHAASFVFTNVAPGPHVVDIRWRSVFEDPVQIAQRAMFVHYR